MKKKEKSGWKEKSAETGKKLQNFVTARSLWQQDITFKERGAAGGKAATLIGITAWLYYRKIWAVPALIPLGIWLYREFLKEEKKKKEQEFQKQFREMIQSLSAALNTGYSVENAFYETQKELKILYPPEARISKELLVITRKLRIHIPVEQVLEEFAEQVLSEDVKSFVTVFVTAKKSGTLPSPFPMYRMDMKSATAISRAVSPQRKSPTSDNQGKRGIPVMYSRGSWITSPF